MQNNYSTSRLVLNKLAPADADFIKELVNTPGWIKFIGDRNIHNDEDAARYIQKIMGDPNIQYWVVKTKDVHIPIGIVTFIKRAYLSHHDIGFAFLPAHAGQGYAREATAAVLNDIAGTGTHTHILATTLKENASSIHLLEKLGFIFSSEIDTENEILLLYAVTADKILIDQLTKTFFGIFTNTAAREPGWDTIRQLCLPETIFIKKTGLTQDIYNLHTFIEPRRKILSDGTLTNFEESEINSETKIIGNIAQRSSTYQKAGCLNGARFREQGHKCFQYIKTTEGWRINALIWEDAIKENL